MTTGPCATLMRKDIREGIRAGGLIIAMAIAVNLVLALMPIVTWPRPSPGQDAAADTYRRAVSAAASAQMTMIVLGTMMYAGNMVVSILVTREKTRRTMIPILCSGVTPRTVWAAKVAAGFIIAYAASVVSLAVYFGALSVVARAPILPALRSTLVSLVIAPLLPSASFGLACGVSLPFTRAWHLPFLLSISSMVLFSMWHEIADIQENPRSIAAVGVTCLMVTAICWALAGLMPRERVSGVLEWE